MGGISVFLYNKLNSAMHRKKGFGIQQTSADFWPCAYSSVSLSQSVVPGARIPPLEKEWGHRPPSLLPSLASLLPSLSLRQPLQRGEEHGGPWLSLLAALSPAGANLGEGLHPGTGHGALLRPECH